MASASRPHPFGLLPTQIRSRIYNLLIPERLQFVKFGESRKHVQPSDLIPPFTELMQPPPINTIITKLRRHCTLQIHDTYAARAIEDVPITSNERNAGVGKRCFQIKLVTQRGIDLVVEIQARWDNQTQIDLVKDFQEHVVRSVYSRSVNGRRSKVNNNGNVFNA